MPAVWYKSSICTFLSLKFGTVKDRSPTVKPKRFDRPLVVAYSTAHKLLPLGYFRSGYFSFTFVVHPPPP